MYLRGQKPSERGASHPQSASPLIADSLPRRIARLRPVNASLAQLHVNQVNSISNFSQLLRLALITLRRLDISVQLDPILSAVRSGLTNAFHLN